MGFFGRGQMVSEFEEVAFAMDEGEISGVVETQFGYHIIKVTGKKPERQAPFEEVEDQIRQSLLNEKINSGITEWVDELRTNATIEIMELGDLPEEAATPEEEAATPEEAATTE